VSRTVPLVRRPGAPDELHPLLAARWSPRGFDPDHTLTLDRLRPLLEAARWAPSSGNTQPVRWVVTLRGDGRHQQLMTALSRGNNAWAGRASALLVEVALDADETGRPYRTALHDAGQAAAHLTLQAVAEGLVAHQMAGFDVERAREVLGLAPEQRPVVVIAVGVLGGPPLDEKLAAREAAPRTRRPVEELLL
jgi:nitroreductase